MTKNSILVCAIAICLPSCSSTSVPKEALALGPESIENRQVQTRRFDTSEEKKLLIAAAGLLQDEGYIIEESETVLGVIVASKDRDATDTGQQVASFLVGVLFGSRPSVDDVQKIRAAVVTRPATTHPGSMLLRVTFQRIVWNDRGRISRREPINDAELYQKFFNALGKAIFLESHKI